VSGKRASSRLFLDIRFDNGGVTLTQMQQPVTAFINRET
jgi:hypothetical protein